MNKALLVTTIVLLTAAAVAFGLYVYTSRMEEEPSVTADSDGDGLSDFEEVNVYNSDPRNADTDGDGFADGVEVQNGFDPNGPGRLVQ